MVSGVNAFIRFFFSKALPQGFYSITLSGQKIIKENNPMQKILNTFAIICCIVISSIAAPCNNPAPDEDISGDWVEKGNPERVYEISKNLSGGFNFVATGGGLCWDSYGTIEYISDYNLNGYGQNQGCQSDRFEVVATVLTKDDMRMTFYYDRGNASVELYRVD
jgi:hypothetical protein